MCLYIKYLYIWYKLYEYKYINVNTRKYFQNICCICVHLCIPNKYTQYTHIGLSKDPVLRYQVGTKKMKTSRYQDSLSPGGTEDPVDSVLAARSESCRCARFITAQRRADIKRRKCIKLIKHFKDRHPDQMKAFKQVSFYLIFRYSVMNIIPYLNLNVGLK